MFYKTDDRYDYFWLAFVFICSDAPGDLFSSFDIQHTLSVIRSSDIGIMYFWMGFILIAYYKYRNQKIDNNYLSFAFKIITFHFVFVIIITLILGFAFYKFIPFIRRILPWLFIFIFPRILRDDVSLVNFFRLILSFVPLIFLLQILMIIFKFNIAENLGGVNLAIEFDNDKSSIRVIYSPLVLLISIIGSIYILMTENNRFNNRYLWTLIIISTISIFLSGTRGWLFAVLLILFLFFMIDKKKISRLINVALSLLIIIPLISLNQIFDKTLDTSFDRISTITLLTQGDETAGNTLQRTAIRGPRVMKKFSESQFLGFGFSDVFFDYEDEHVGNQTMLLNIGYFGFSFFVFFILFVIFKNYELYSQIESNSNYKKMLLMSIGILIGIYFIHSTSRQIFSYLTDFYGGFLVSFYLFFSNFIYQRAKERELINTN